MEHSPCYCMEHDAASGPVIKPQSEVIRAIRMEHSPCCYVDHGMKHKGGHHLAACFRLGRRRHHHLHSPATRGDPGHHDGARSMMLHGHFERMQLKREFEQAKERSSAIFQPGPT